MMTTPNKTKSKYISAQDLYRFQLPTDCQISPDGNWVVYSLKRVDRKSEKKYTNLWVAPTSPGQPRQFTQGNHTDSSPRWSPDSQTVAFISGRDEENQSQIYLMPMQGGEAYKLSDLKGELGAFRWSPDGKKIVLQFRKTDAEELEREKDEDKKKLGVVARHIDRVFFKLDDEGYLPKERWHLWIIDAKTGKATQLTDHAIFDENFPAWSPDSKQIAFISNHAKDPDLDPDNFDLFTVAATGGTAKKMTRSRDQNSTRFIHPMGVGSPMPVRMAKAPGGRTCEFLLFRLMAKNLLEISRVNSMWTHPWKRSMTCRRAH